MRLLPFSLAFLLAAQAAAAYKVAGWDIQLFPNDREPTGCVMGGDFKDGTHVARTRLRLIVTRDYKWAIGLHNKEWTLEKNGTTDVTAYVDRKFIGSGKAVHINRDLVLLPLSGKSTFRTLRTGRKLILRTHRGTSTFGLKGVSKAMAAVIECVRYLPV